MPRSDTQNEQIRAAARAKLIASAMQLFAEYGYAHTSVRKIASHAGVAVGLLYHYFPGKVDLLQTVFEHCMAIISAGFGNVIGETDPLRRAAELVGYIFDALQTDRVFWDLFYSLRAQPAVMGVLGGDFRLWTGRLRALFVHAFQEAGREHPETDAYVLYSLVEGTIQQYLLDPGRYPLATVVKQIYSQIGVEPNS